jgi:U3 small nucleolar RNA-associated protein 20
MVDYPLGKKRLEKHLNFVIANLTYEYETGRHSALSVLKDVCQIVTHNDVYL